MITVRNSCNMKSVKVLMHYVQQFVNEMRFLVLVCEVKYSQRAEREN